MYLVHPGVLGMDSWRVKDRRREDTTLLYLLILYTLSMLDSHPPHLLHALLITNNIEVEYDS